MRAHGDKDGGQKTESIWIISFIVSKSKYKYDKYITKGNV